MIDKHFGAFVVACAIFAIYLIPLPIWWYVLGFIGGAINLLIDMTKDEESETYDITEVDLFIFLVFILFGILSLLFSIISFRATYKFVGKAK